MIGDKGELIRRVEQQLFDNYLYKKNPEDAMKEMSDTDLESMLRNVKRAPKEDKTPTIQELHNLVKSGK
jgi:predicted transcriptional regulator